MEELERDVKVEREGVRPPKRSSDQAGLDVDNGANESSAHSCRRIPAPTVSTTDRCFRLSDIPSTWTEDKVLGILEEKCNLTRSPSTRLTLLPSIHDSQFQVGLLSIQRLRDFVDSFAPKEHDNYRRHVQCGDVQIIIDRHFYGLTPLNNPGIAPVADIVAITGLAGHAFGSWKDRISNKMWLHDFLPGHLDCPVRILTYGYNTTLAEHTSRIDGMADLVEGFLRQLESSRAKDNERPLFLIGHSLGCVIITKALVLCNQEDQQQRLQQILRSTKMLIFFGAPHRGLRTEELEAMIADSELPNKQRSETLLHQLVDGSKYLQDHLAAFKKVWNEKKVISLYETLMTPAVMKNPTTGIFGRGRKRVVMVPKSSAILYLSQEIPIPVDRDHSEMAKLGTPSDPAYLSVLNHVQEELNNIKQKLNKSQPNDSTKVSALNRIPFPRNPNYIERRNIHQRLDEILAPNEDYQPRAALWALGGMGKTTIAVEHCHRKAKLGTSVLWVHANTKETFQESYRNIHKIAKLPGSDRDMDELQIAVKDFLESPESGAWFMVIDNLDDLSIEGSYIPIRRGALLITTRNRQVLQSPYFEFSQKAKVVVEKMSLDEASLICETYGMSQAPEEVRAQTELLRILDGLPLGIAQVAAYIQQTGVTSQWYLKRFTEKQAVLLDKPAYKVSHGDDKSSKTVMRTWTVTIEHIKDDNPLAVETLELMSVLDHEDIPLSVIKEAPGYEDVDELDLVEAIGLLCNFALITRQDGDDQRFRLHPLVSFSTRSQLQSQRRDKVLELGSASLIRSFPQDSLGNLPFCSMLMPHAFTILRHFRKEKPENDAFWLLHRKAIEIVNIQGQYNQALEMGNEALKYQENALGEDHPGTLTTVHNIGAVFENQGDYGKALEWYRRALKGREKVLGNEHPDTLCTFHRMASVFDGLGEYETSLEWYQRALEGREKVLGKDHESTLGTVHNMAFVFEQQGEYVKSLEWYQRVLDGEEKALGKDHPNTLSTVENMATVRVRQGDYAKALSGYLRTLKGREKVLGEEHPHTLCTVHNIALVFDYQAEYQKSLEWYQRALSGREKVLGKDHTNTFDSVHNMAFVYDHLDEYEEAEGWYRRALEGRQKTLGQDHPHTLEIFDNMGSVFLGQGNHTKALEWFQRALEGREKVLGKEHPDTLTTVHNIGAFFEDKGEYEDALKWYQRALEGREKGLGKGHPEIFNTVHKMASVFHKQGNCDKALKWYQRALEGRENALGIAHPDTLETVYGIASIFDDQAEYEKALEWYQRALEGQERIFGEYHKRAITTSGRIKALLSKKLDGDKQRNEIDKPEAA